MDNNILAWIFVYTNPQNIGWTSKSRLSSPFTNPPIYIANFLVSIILDPLQTPNIQDEPPSLYCPSSFRHIFFIHCVGAYFNIDLFLLHEAGFIVLFGITYLRILVAVVNRSLSQMKSVRKT